MHQLPPAGPSGPDNAHPDVPGLPAQPRGDAPHCECVDDGRLGLVAVDVAHAGAGPGVDYVCGTCRRPTRLYREAVIEPREREKLNAPIPSGRYVVRVADAGVLVTQKGVYLAQLRLVIGPEDPYRGCVVWFNLAPLRATLAHVIRTCLAFGVPDARVRAWTESYFTGEVQSDERTVVRKVEALCADLRGRTGVAVVRRAAVNGKLRNEVLRVDPVGSES